MDPTEQITEDAVVPAPEFVKQTTVDESMVPLPVPLPAAAEADPTMVMATDEAVVPLPAAEPQAAEPQAVVMPTEVHYTTIEGGTQRGGTLLVDSNGFSYVMRRLPGASTTWRCQVRGKPKKCYASLKQVGNLYTPGPHDHNHPGNPGVETRV